MNCVTTSFGVRRHSSASASAAAKVSVAVSSTTGGRMRISFAKSKHTRKPVLLPFVGNAYKYVVMGGRLQHERHCRADSPNRKARARACDRAGYPPDPPRSVHLRLLYRQVAVQRGGRAVR